jgi:hypothetical protein
LPNFTTSRFILAFKDRENYQISGMNDFHLFCNDDFFFLFQLLLTKKIKFNVSYSIIYVYFADSDLI